MPDLLELLVGELRFQRVHEPDRGLARGIGDDVELDRWLGHGRSVTRLGPAGIDGSVTEA
jgi:hypothetical protein